MWICLFILTAWSLIFGQEIKVIKSAGSEAVISGGSNYGFREGGLVRVMRMRNGMWKEISSAKITMVTPDMSRIEVMEGAPMVTFKPGDVIFKISLVSGSSTNLPNSSINTFSPRNSPGFQNSRGVYLGPTVDMLLPQGDMKKYFNDEVGYGAMVGFRFQNSFDISVRFMFAAQSDEWSFWNLELLGRVYDASNLFADFGYGICYPGISSQTTDSDRNPQTIRMGFIIGGGYPLPISINKEFEVGVLYHYYPNFIKTAGQFFSVHGRLIIKSN